MKATVLGSTGFIGTALVARLRHEGYAVETPSRAELSELKGDLGAVFYCIGMTGNFRLFPHLTIQSQVTLLSELMQRCSFSSLVYLSSTRVYGITEHEKPAQENQILNVLPSPDSTYDLAKLLGEALCATYPDARMISARLSNVYGAGMSSNTFLGSVLGSVVRDGEVVISEEPSSAKDYVSVEDVVTALATISRDASSGCYNLASGRVTSHQEIAVRLRELDFKVEFQPNTLVRKFPPISVDKLVQLCDFCPRYLADDLPALVTSLKLENGESS
ncbi:NAD-dependent epimerase/dehydratase [Sulfitobacter sp. SK012]|uniref:NAD-dependent epimerase/dehydratase family protein n=1 Tax=Sulfitobacter sp. SK012 TaxID=1389005 RepID=UPI000E0BDCA9|nr:NAD(P)-dependent oxidoreductase [Sulfitobacter sp. SK012]AXI48172.1 NAD-dependent epimerase/dehydratase [Sulfitobacter sp. SK012]